MSKSDNTPDRGVRLEAAIGATVIGIQLFAVYLVLLVGLAGILGFGTSGVAIPGGIAGLGALVSAWRLYGPFRANLAAAQEGPSA